MLHLTTVVSRKTPLDGRLEIPESLAERLAATGEPLVVSIASGESPASVEAMACTCAKGAGGNHRHHFLSAEVLRSLPAGANATLFVDTETGRVSVNLSES